MLFRKLINRRDVCLIFVFASVSLIAVPQIRAQGGDQNSTGAAQPASGVDTSTQLSENPPVSGLDEPSFEPRFGTRSYLLPGAQVSEAVDSNQSSTGGSGNRVGNETYALGSLDLQKLWRTHPLDLDYLGGVGWYSGPAGNAYQLHALTATQRFLWRTGQFALRDSFNYLPEGTFGFNSFGGAAAFSGASQLADFGGGVLSGAGIPGAGGGVFLGFGQFGSIGNEPRINNMSIADITQYLSPRSSIVVTGGFGISDFRAKNAFGYLNSREVVSEAGYNYQLSRKDQIGLMYAFEEFHYPTSDVGSLNVSAWQVMYAHRISGRLNLVISGGPAWIHTHQMIDVLGIIFVPINSSLITESGQISLAYHVSARTNVSLGYLRYINPGSGFFAGARTDAVNLGISHVLGRRWNIVSDFGYSGSAKVLTATAPVANNAQTYHFWFAGGALRRQLSRQFGVYGSYQYNAFGSGTGFCVSFSCNTYARQIGLVGVDWTPHPIRLD